MTLETIIQGVSHRVELETLPNGSHRMVLNGAPYEMDVEVLPGNVYSLIIDGKQLELSLGDGRNGIEIESAGYRYPVEVVDPRTKAARSGAESAGGTTTITSSMPGKVMRLLVGEGEKVARGSGLVVIEAMKMQNELRAPIDGQVKKVYVSEGDKVEANARLLLIDALEDGGAKEL